MADDAWQQWVQSHAGQAQPMTADVSAGTGGGVPMYADPTAQDRQNISYILNPNFDTSETRMRGAEMNLGQGVEGSGFGSGTTNRLLESEKLARFKLGNEMLQPYQERAATAANLATTGAQRLNEIAAQGAQALQQLQISEAGQSARLSQEEAARLQQIALAGQQAMSELQLREAGESSRLNRQIGSQENLARLNLGGNILQTLLQASTRGGGGGAGVPSTYPGTGGTTTFDWTSQTHDVIPGTPPVNRTFNFSGNLGSAVNRILRQYGITV